MRKLKKKIAAVIFMLTWFMVFFLVGSMEQDYIPYSTGMMLCAVDYIVMWISGRVSGALKIYY